MHDVQLSAPALAASTDALLQQSTAAKSAVSVLDEENGMMEEEPAYQMNLKDGSIRVYIGEDGKQYAKQGNNEAQQKDDLQITTDGGRTTNTLTIEGGTTGAKVTLSNVNIDAPGAQSRSAAMWSWLLQAPTSCAAARTAPVWKRQTMTGP